MKIVLIILLGLLLAKQTQAQRIGEIKKRARKSSSSGSSSSSSSSSSGSDSDSNGSGCSQGDWGCGALIEWFTSQKRAERQTDSYETQSTQNTQVSEYTIVHSKKPKLSPEEVKKREWEAIRQAVIRDSLARVRKEALIRQKADSIVNNSLPDSLRSRYKHITVLPDPLPHVKPARHQNQPLTQAQKDSIDTYIRTSIRNLREADKKEGNQRLDSIPFVSVAMQANHNFIPANYGITRVRFRLSLFSVLTFSYRYNHLREKILDEITTYFSRDIQLFQLNLSSRLLSKSPENVNDYIIRAGWGWMFDENDHIYHEGLFGYTHFLNKRRWKLAGEFRLARDFANIRWARVEFNTDIQYGIVNKPIFKVWGGFHAKLADYFGVNIWSIGAGLSVRFLHK